MCLDKKEETVYFVVFQLCLTVLNDDELRRNFYDSSYFLCLWLAELKEIFDNYYFDSLLQPVVPVNILHSMP